MYKHSHSFTLPLLAAMLFLTSCNKPQAPELAAVLEKPAQHEEAANKLQLTAEEMKQAGIVVRVIQPEPIADQMILTANIAANQDRIAHITPRVEGRLIKVSANLGEEVKTGQALAVIDSIQMGEARAEYRNSQSELKLAESTFQRSDRLYREEVIPQKQWLQAKAEYERAQASAREGANHLQLLGGLSDNGASTFVVTAPFAGTVIEKSAVLGELAKPDSSLFTIADLSNMWIEADVSEKDLGKLTIGAPATVTISAFPDETFHGDVSYISSIFDRQTRTVKARIALPNPDRKLRIDMFARAVIDLARSRQGLVLPQEAVLLVQGQSTVYVQVAGGFEAKPVEVGEQLSKGVVINNGLQAGDMVVTAGAYMLKSRQLKSQIGDEH